LDRGYFGKNFETRIVEMSLDGGVLDFIIIGNRKRKGKKEYSKI
jgi:hypothetical protein